MARLEWHRRRDEQENVYYVEKRGRYMIDKKITDDREFDGGCLNAEWILHSRDSSNGEYSWSPMTSHNALGEAKSQAEQFV